MGSLDKVLRLSGSAPVKLNGVSVDEILKLARQPHVKTPEGAKKYGEPIGAPITKDMVERVSRAAKGSVSAVRSSGAKNTKKLVDLTKTSLTRKSSISAKEYRLHVEHVTAMLKMNEARATNLTETVPGTGGRMWKPEREAIHNKIVEDLYRAAGNVPNDKKALISGGLGGAGKTTVLTQYANVNLDDYLTINADDIKEEMHARGLIPEIPGLSPAEASVLVHTEASHITKLLSAKAMADGKNVLRDITMSGAGDGAEVAKQRVQDLKEAGYTVDSVFVDIPIEVAVSRALSRHRSGMERRKKGEGWGGRFVPPEIIRENASIDPDSPHDSSNREVFEGLKSEFSDWRVYDNSVDGEEPKFLDGTPRFEASVSGRLKAGVIGDASEQVAAKQAVAKGSAS